jgi:O-antigen/teichoic acid export membrane protein
VARDRRLKIEFDADVIRRVLRYGFTVYIAQAIFFLLVRVDVLLVQYYRDSYELGLYSAAGDFSQAIVQLQAVVNMLVFPRLATLASEEERRRVTRRIVQRAMAAYAVLIVILALGANFVVQAIFGAEFAPTAAALVWLLPGAGALAIASILQNHIGAAGRPIDMAFAPAVALVTQVILCFLLIPRFGMVGAAVSCCVSFVLMGIVAAFKALRA